MAVKTMTLGVALYSGSWFEVEVPNHALAVLPTDFDPHRATTETECALLEVLGVCGPEHIGQDSVAKIWVHAWE